MNKQIQMTNCCICNINHRMPKCISTRYLSYKSVSE